MKKVFTVVIVVFAILLAGSANAQNKIGYISVDNMVQLMPELGKLDTLMQRYQTDSLNPRYAYLVTEYQRKDSMYRDSLRTPAATRKIIGDELQGIVYEIQNWQSISQQMIEDKQNELLRPVYTKVYDAIKLVAKEKGYTHVFNKEAFLVAPEGDDMILLVAQKLKVNIPLNTPKTNPAGKVGNK
jgi:outer membrane protein